MSTKYGNDHYWTFIEEGWNGKEVAIWKGPEGQEEIIARAKDKYEAKTIIDALLQHVNVEDSSKLTKKELAFLEFVSSNCVEPYATMATNAVLWNDKAAFEELKNKFATIYT
jgi:hypothetical protein